MFERPKVSEHVSKTTMPRFELSESVTNFRSNSGKVENETNGQKVNLASKVADINVDCFDDEECFGSTQLETKLKWVRNSKTQSGFVMSKQKKPTLFTF